ncbi:hypothetical protein N7530_012696 [Penicillium desertorum]|uniref:Gfo/Idh/MocA-like oxidoreductase N-terminal domain-containing protein n=1 Tax=Penicillium desertorum TaxID=1303715 RepID=A0A9X0BFI8_9EURO|nr:hypothetical protein N7530_012696 [Penicillium desertorum]
MAMIRVGLIGLSGAADKDYEGTSWTPSAHLPYLRASPHFKIVALLNSSVDSAKAAIKKYGLSAETKAYSDPNDLANDAAVDLVVCSVRVDRHFLTVRPSIIARKIIYVEWPLERNLEVVNEMAHLAALHNTKTIAGLQGSFAPVIRKMKTLVQQGAIGNIISSTFDGALGNGGATENKSVRYFLERVVGGNAMSIHCGHCIESVTSVLGQFEKFISECSIRRPTIDIVDSSLGKNDKVIVKGARNTVPDQILIHGTVKPSNAVVTLNLHGGKGCPGVPRVNWRIEGEKGWLRLTSPVFFINIGSPELKLEIFNAEDCKVQEVALGPDEWDELPLPARNIARLYEAYRKDEWYPDFEWALKRHELVNEMWRRFDEGA